MLHAHRGRLDRYFLLLLNEPAVAEALIAKDRFQAFAESHGLPVPRALTWGQGPNAVADHPGPVLIKPRNKHNWHDTVMCHQLFAGDGKARAFASGAAVRADPEVEVFHDQLTFQEYVPGGDEELWSYHGFADECSQVIASFTGRKVRTFPVDMGESAYIELARNDVLESLGRELVRRCPLRGPFKMDFKRDPESGRFYLLEVNARYTLWHLLGAVNGVNLMRVAYDYLLQGERPSPRRWKTRYRWLSMTLDYRAYRELAAAGRLSFPRWLASVALSPKVCNVWSLSDPMPWLDQYLQRARRFAARRGSRLLLKTWRSTAS
jgi:predicted ATP-grasp superfamily ATP-dependent carboligase